MCLNWDRGMLYQINKMGVFRKSYFAPMFDHIWNVIWGSLTDNLEHSRQTLFPLLFDPQASGKKEWITPG